MNPGSGAQLEEPCVGEWPLLDWLPGGWRARTGGGCQRCRDRLRVRQLSELGLRRDGSVSLSVSRRRKGATVGVGSISRGRVGVGSAGMRPCRVRLIESRA